MIFNVNTSGEKLVLPVLSTSYPANVNTSFDYGGSTSATFEVKIATPGKPDIYTYQWFVDGVEILGATSKSYAMNNITTAGTKRVWCVVTNKAGSVESNHATLTVTENYRLPVLNASYPANTTVKFDPGSSTSATFKIKIATAGNPDSQTYQWYYDDEPVSGATGTTYTRSGLNAVGEHEVYCLVTHASGGTVKSNVATLTVRKKFTYSWTGSSNMDFYYGDGSEQTGSNGKTTLIGSHQPSYETRYGQVLWFDTDDYGGTGFTFDWNPVDHTGSSKTVYCRISETGKNSSGKWPGCTNHSTNALSYTTTSNGYRFSDTTTVFKPNTRYYIYLNRTSYDYGYFHYASNNSGWGTSSIKIH